MTRAIIYTRFSPRRDAADCDSCEAQEDICVEHALKRGYTVAAVFSDKDISGGELDRPGLKGALAFLKKGDILLCYKRDRIARDVLIGELTRRQVKAVGATIEAVTGDVEGDTPYIVMIRQVLDAVAELERKMTAERTSHVMRRHQAAGRKMGRFAPYGRSVDPDDTSRLIEDPNEQEAVLRIKELADSGDCVHAITHKMNVEMPDLARGKQWTQKTVKKIIGR